MFQFLFPRMNTVTSPQNSFLNCPQFIILTLLRQWSSACSEEIPNIAWGIINSAYIRWSLLNSLRYHQRIVRWCENFDSKRCERKRPWPILRHCPRICLEELRKTTNTLVRKVEIWNLDLPNKKQEARLDVKDEVKSEDGQYSLHKGRGSLNGQSNEARDR